MPFSLQRTLADHETPAPYLSRACGLFICLGILLFCAVVVLKPKPFFADDSYFYMQVAWNFAHGAGSTFNGLMPTNGYHPLWMLVCAAVCMCVSSKLAALHAVAVVICVCDVLQLWVIARICRAVAGRFYYVAFILAVPFDFLTQLGTEGALSGLLLALTMLCAFRFVARPGRTSAFAFHAAATFSVLSRLDNVFIVA